MNGPTVTPSLSGGGDIRSIQINNIHATRAWQSPDGERGGAMPKVLLIHNDSLDWANPWSMHPIRAPDHEEVLVRWPTPMHWFQAQSLNPTYPEVVKAVAKSRGCAPRARFKPGDSGYEESMIWQLDMMKALKVPVRMRNHNWVNVWVKKLTLAMAYKFDQYDKLQALLLETRGAAIIYDSADSGMGSGYIDPVSGRFSGANALGKILMKIRKQLKIRKKAGSDAPLIRYPETDDERRIRELEEHYENELGE
jgi:hypothetical protein